MHIFANSFLFFLMFFQFSAVHAAVIDSTVKNGVIYFLHDVPAKVTRHNFIQNSWLPEITIEKGAKCIQIDNYYIYAMGHSNLYRYNITTKSKTEIGNDLSCYTSVHTDGDLLITVSNQLNEPSVINIYNKENLTPITVNFPIMGYASEATISPNQNRLYLNMTHNAAGSTRIDYSPSGTVVFHRNNFFDNGSAARNKSWLSPSEDTLIYENGRSYLHLLDSGGFKSSNITNPISGVVFLENKELVIASGNTITLYDANMNKKGDKEFKSKVRSVASNNDLLYIYLDDTASTGAEVVLHSVTSLRGAEKIEPKGLSYTVDDGMVDKSGNVLILSKKYKSIFIWDTRKQDYVNSIPLFSIPLNFTYSPVWPYRVFSG